MSHQPLFSIIITNYNYARYLPETIDSALNQTYPHIEVIVVDDGSTDDSRAVMAGYGDAITALYKPNGGQSSAANVGYAASRGELVMFLDSDDVLLPQTIERVVAAFAPGVSKVQFRLQVVDADRQPMGLCLPPMSHRMPNGDERETVLKGRCYPSPPTSGNAYTRALLERIMPIPIPAFDMNFDSYQINLAALFGTIASLSEPGGLYRVHGKNFWATGFNAFDVEHLARYVADVCARTDLVREWAGREGLSPGPHAAFQYPGELVRMLALKLMAPDHPLLAGRSRPWLAWRGIAAVWSEPYPPGALRRVAMLGWFASMVFLPRGLAIALAEWMLFRRRRSRGAFAPQHAFGA